MLDHYAPPSPQQARKTSDLCLVHERTPLPEVTELPDGEGWSQWDLAVWLQDGPAA